MIKTAVILAAGLGSRLNDKTKNKPKGFIKIEGISLIERSVESLLRCGIEKIFIGTGYLSEVYDDLKEKYPQIETIKSDKYQTTGSMYTLYNMREKVKEDFLLLESDLLYEIDSLKYLLFDSQEDIILASGKTNSKDEVFIDVDEQYHLIKMSKNKSKLNSADCELVGISKISKDRYKSMCNIFEELNNPKIDYEYVMEESTRSKPFLVKKVDKLIWCEIDNAQHLNRAEEMIFPRIKAKDPLMVKRNILLNPGPATTTDTVKMAQVVPDICPREKEFGDLMEYVSEELTSIVADTEEYTTILFGGSGTAVIESILTSVVPDDKTVIIVNNGAYGKRMCQIADRFKLNYLEFKSSSIEPVDMRQLEDFIRENQRLSHIAVVHHETTTGLLNDLEEFGRLSRKYNVELIVDAMSSYAAVPIDMQKQNISYLAASSNKNIQGMAGVGFVIAAKESLDKLKDVEPRSFYLSLYEQYQNFIKTHQMRFTPPVQVLYALKQAIIEAKAEGIEKRYVRYSKMWKFLITSLKEMNLEYLIEDKYHSKIITSVYIPDGVDFEHMHDYFYSRGVTIYPGKVGEYNTFRIANIGDINLKDIKYFITELKCYLETKH